MRPYPHFDTTKLHLALGDDRIRVGQKAEIEADLWYDYPELVEAIVKEFGAPCGKSDDAFTLDLDRNDPRMSATVVEVEPGDKVSYAFHTEQTSSLRQPVPFVQRDVVKDVGSITLHMTGSAEKPIIVRLYAGEYRPGLPWQKSVRGDDKSLEESIAYWKTHAYVFQPHIVIGQLDAWPPMWVSNFSRFLSRDKSRRESSRGNRNRR